MGVRRQWSVAVTAAVTVAAVYIGCRPYGDDAGGDPVVTIVPGVAVRAGDATPPVTTVPVVVAKVARARPVPARDAARTAGRRDMELVEELAEKGPPEQQVLGDVMLTHERDAARAQPVEAAMQAAFARVSGLTGSGGPTRVTCVSTTCEVTGMAAAGQTAEAVEQALRDPVLLQAMVDRGYMPGPVTVSSAGGATRFIMYLNNEM